MISVLIVDDSVAARRTITDALIGVPDMRVVGSVGDGRAALAKLATSRADVVLLDVDMPGTDGLATLSALRQAHPELPVIMLSPPGPAAAGSVLDALAAGANDVVIKPAGAASVVASLQTLRARLLPRIFALCARGPSTARRGPVRTLRPAPRPRPGADAAVEVLAISSTTGTTGALASLLADLPPALGVPVLVAHAAPAGYTPLLADRLDARCALRVITANPETPLRAGTVYLAPAGSYLAVSRDPAADLTQLLPEPDDEFAVSPADTLFRAVAVAFGPGALAVALAPDVEDGLAGATLLRAVGGEVVVRGEQAGTGWPASEILPGDQLVAYLRERLESRAAVPAASGRR